MGGVKWQGGVVRSKEGARQGWWRICGNAQERCEGLGRMLGDAQAAERCEAPGDCKGGTTGLRVGLCERPGWQGLRRGGCAGLHK